MLLVVTPTTEVQLLGQFQVTTIATQLAIIIVCKIILTHEAIEDKTGLFDKTPFHAAIFFFFLLVISMYFDISSRYVSITTPLYKRKMA